MVRRGGDTNLSSIRSIGLKGFEIGCELVVKELALETSVVERDGSHLCHVSAAATHKAVRARADVIGGLRGWMCRVT